MFVARPSYDRYRALALQEPHLVGEDVYSLQTAINDLAERTDETIPVLDTDGVFGPKTGASLQAAQVELGLERDGKAGPKTWVALGNNIGGVIRRSYMIRAGLVYGQLAHESSFRGGAYSDLHQEGTVRESWDAGVAQANSKIWPDIKGSFTYAQAIGRLCASTRSWYMKFEGVADTRRRWGLAAGAWNAPYWAAYIAVEEGAKDQVKAQPTDAQRAVLEAYIASVTAYMR